MELFWRLRLKPSLELEIIQIRKEQKMTKKFRRGLRGIILIAAVFSFFAGSALAQTEGFINEPYQKAFDTSYRMALEGKYDAAIAPLADLYKKDPKDFPVVFRLGYLCYLKGDFAASIKFYREAVSLRPQAVETHLGLILPYMAQKDYNGAVAAGTAALKVDPNNPTALGKVAYAYYLLGDFKSAARYYQKFLDLYPMDVTMRLGLGWSYLQSGDKARAKEEFTQILLISPYDKSALLGYSQSK